MTKSFRDFWRANIRIEKILKSSTRATGIGGVVDLLHTAKETEVALAEDWKSEEEVED